MKKISERSIAKEVLLKMQKQVGDLIVQHISESMMSPKLRKLQTRYNATGGDGSLLLPKILPKRCKFCVNGQYCDVSFVCEIAGAEDYLVVYDCGMQKISVRERPIEPPLYC